MLRSWSTAGSSPATEAAAAPAPPSGALPGLLLLLPPTNAQLPAPSLAPLWCSARGEAPRALGVLLHGIGATRLVASIQLTYASCSNCKPAAGKSPHHVQHSSRAALPLIDSRLIAVGAAARQRVGAAVAGQAAAVPQQLAATPAARPRAVAGNRRDATAVWVAPYPVQHPDHS